MRTSYLIFTAVLLCSCKEAGDSADAPVDEADADTDADSDADTDTDIDPECWIDGPSGLCYDCDPPTAAESDSTKFLNQCTDASFAPFDNAARIPSSTWVPGEPLPPVP